MSAILTHGGGITGQSGAICQGMARALKNMFSEAMAVEGTAKKAPPAAWSRNSATPATSPAMAA